MQKQDEVVTGRRGSRRSCRNSCGELELGNMESVQVRWGKADSLPEFDRERGEKDRKLTGGSRVWSERTKITTGMKFRR
jgi:hypothetical protein